MTCWVNHALPRAPLPRDFYRRPTLDVARDLLGQILVHHSRGQVSAGRIVEVEAYIGESDPACHAAPGPTPRNRPLYGPCGHAYVYLNYGIHYLVNAVTEDEGFPAAVLIRALEPLEGVHLMRRRRSVNGHGADDHMGLCRGPGNLSRSLGITIGHNCFDLTSSRLRIEGDGCRPQAIAWSRRIGIRVGVEREWRCYVTGNPAVSAHRADPA